MDNETANQKELLSMKRKLKRGYGIVWKFDFSFFRGNWILR